MQRLIPYMIGILFASLSVSAAAPILTADINRAAQEVSVVFALQDMAGK